MSGRSKSAGGEYSKSVFKKEVVTETTVNMRKEKAWCKGHENAADLKKTTLLGQQGRAGAYFERWVGGTLDRGGGASFFQVNVGWVSVDIFNKNQRGGGVRVLKNETDTLKNMWWTHDSRQNHRGVGGIKTPKATVNMI